MDRRLAASLIALLGLAGCAGLGAARPLTLSQAELQRAIERHFPLQRRLFELIDIQVARPTVRLLPERKRIATEFDLAASERLSGRLARGHLTLDHALRYEPSDASVRMAQVQVQQFRLELDGGPLSPSSARVAALLAERLLDDFVLYRADPQRLRQLQQAGVSAADISVTESGLEIRFVPSR
jgi:hypothetical protein